MPVRPCRYREYIERPEIGKFQAQPGGSPIPPGACTKQAVWPIWTSGRVRRKAGMP